MNLCYGLRYIWRSDIGDYRTNDCNQLPIQMNQVHCMYVPHIVWPISSKKNLKISIIEITNVKLTIWNKKKLFNIYRTSNDCVIAFEPCSLGHLSDLKYIHWHSESLDTHRDHSIFYVVQLLFRQCSFKLSLGSQLSAKQF